MLTPAAGGMAGVSLAEPQDVPAAIFGNPATLTQFHGTQFTLGGAWVEGYPTVSNNGSLNSGTPFSVTSRTQGFAIPAIGVIQDLRPVGLPAVLAWGLPASAAWAPSIAAGRRTAVFSITLAANTWSSESTPRWASNLAKPFNPPLLTLTDTRRPDFVTPPLIAANPRALEVFAEAMERAWAAKNHLLELDVPLEKALYLLPTPRRCVSTRRGACSTWRQVGDAHLLQRAGGDLRASMDELAQVRAVHPRLVRHMGPPCVIRHGLITPTCTEGEHFCGVPVWRSFPDVKRPL